MKKLIGIVAALLLLASTAFAETSIKVDGNTFNPVDPARAKEFIARARDVRAQYK